MPRGLATPPKPVPTPPVKTVIAINKTVNTIDKTVDAICWPVKVPKIFQVVLSSLESGL